MSEVIPLRPQYAFTSLAGKNLFQFTEFYLQFLIHFKQKNSECIMHPIFVIVRLVTGTERASTQNVHRDG